MEIVGQRINTSLPGIDELVASRDEKRLIQLCRDQLLYGADRISINAGTRVNTEVDDLLWMTRTIQDAMEVQLMADSPNPEALRVVAENNRYGRVALDSTNLEESRIQAVLPIVKEYNCPLVVLLQDEKGMPETVEDRLRLMPKVEQLMKEYSLNKDEVYLDCLVFPVAVEDTNAKLYLDCVSAVRQAYPGYRFTCGLNNISFGMPERPILDITFLLFQMAMGIDYFMLELDPASGAFIKAAKAILGQDEYTMDYITAYKEKWFPHL